ncbi:MAG: hypothetical protein ACREQE_11890, partial [Candidatus Binataceae bacterium]
MRKSSRSIALITWGLILTSGLILSGWQPRAHAAGQNAPPAAAHETALVSAAVISTPSGAHCDHADCGKPLSAPVASPPLQPSAAPLPHGAPLIAPSRLNNLPPTLICDESGKNCVEGKPSPPRAVHAASSAIRLQATTAPSGPWHLSALPTMVCDASGEHCVRGGAPTPISGEKLAALHPPAPVPAASHLAAGVSEGEVLYDKASRAEDRDSANWSAMA